MGEKNSINPLETKSKEFRNLEQKAYLKLLSNSSLTQLYSEIIFMVELNHLNALTITELPFFGHLM